MSGSADTDLYVQGRDSKLDRNFSTYKKLSLWSGDGISCALSEEDANSLIDLWKKEQRTRWLLTVRDVSTLVELSARISSFRMNMKKEKARLRKERSRKKLRNAAKEGDINACRKTEEIKKGDRERATKYYKRKSKRKNLVGANSARVKRMRTRT